MNGSHAPVVVCYDGSPARRGPWRLVGARTSQRLAESLGALDVELTADDLAQIEDAIPAGAAAGERYLAEQMAIL
jgi:diketogulonate reductase-like aldo/keto reductase